MEEAIIESNSEQFSSPGPRPLSRGSISPSRKVNFLQYIIKTEIYYNLVNNSNW